MSNTAKWLVGVVVAALVVLGVWWWSTMNPQGLASPASTTSTEATPSGTNSDSSDQAIEQDMTSVNGQIGAFSSDSASIDQGLNDQPVQQEQL